MFGIEYRGEVCFWSLEGMFGFIRADDVDTISSDVYFYINKYDGRTLPKVGQRVSFILLEGRQGPRAEKVKVIEVESTETAP